MKPRALFAALLLSIAFCPVSRGDFEEALRAYKNRDIPAAIRLLSEAAIAGDSKAAWFLGQIYDRGLQIRKNSGEAAKWYRIAAEQHYPDAEASLGLLYVNGDGVEQDYVQALKWLGLGAEHGQVDAIYNLGVSYLRGWGVERKPQLAVKFFQRAAELEYVDAFYNLGVCFRDGDGVPQSYESAIRWFKAAAGHNEPDSQLALAILYSTGTGVPLSLIEGDKWAILSGEAGNEFASELRQKLEALMTPSQIIDAKNRANAVSSKRKREDRGPRALPQ